MGNGKLGNGNPSNGSVQRRTMPARSPPELWNVHAVMLNDRHRTNNVAEGWNNRLRNLVGHHYPFVRSLIEALQVDAAETSAVLLQHAVGNLQPTGRCRSAVKLQNSLRHLCQQHVEEILWRIFFVLWVMARRALYVRMIELADLCNCKDSWIIF